MKEGVDFQVDIIGNKVFLGDFVVVNPPKYKKLAVAEVTKITPSGVTVYCKGHKQNGLMKEVFNRGVFVKVDYEES